MSWRPKGWEEQIGRVDNGKHPNLDPMWQVFESGADAMLELLREGAIFSTPQTIEWVKRGHLVFIPDEEVKNV